MSWYDCKYCKKYKGDCGNHHVDSNGHTDFEIASSSYCDKYSIPICFKDIRANWIVQGEYEDKPSQYDCRAFNIIEAINLAIEYGYKHIDFAERVRE